MRKVLYLLTILVAFGQIANAQTYYPVTHTSGIQSVNGNNVTVSTVNSPLSVSDVCGPNTSPYFIGQTTASGYSYSFQQPVTHLRLYFAKMHSQDEIIFTINGTHYDVLPSDLTNFSGTCGMLNTQTVNANNNLTMTNAQGVDGGVQVDIQVSPAFVNTLTVYNQPNGTSPDGAAYSLFIAQDSCSQRFEAWVDTPLCRTRDMQLNAYGWPGATYSWSTNFDTWTSNVQNPVRTNAQLWSGQVFVEASRGPCTYYDTIDILVDNIPTIPKDPVTGLPAIIQYGPACPGFDDTIEFSASGLGAGGTFNFIHPNSTLYTNVNNFQAVEPVSHADSGTWRVFAESINGCVSDTEEFNFIVYPDVTANFAVDTGQGCGTDTVFLTNNSFSVDPALTYLWRFDDPNVNPSSTSQDPIHVYTNQGTYTIKLYASTQHCVDSFDREVTINHPLVVDFDIDDDSLCQGDSIMLTNNSVLTAGTNARLWLWEFGTGDTSQRQDADTFYTYSNQGIYTVKLVVVDFLGCRDSLEKTVVVDSSGFISFNVSDDSICVGQAIDFSGTYNEQGNTGIQWNMADGVLIDDSTSLRHVYEQAGTYNVVFDATYRICPDVSFTRPMFVGAYPTVDLGSDTAICLHGEPVWIEELMNASNPNATFLWNTPTQDATAGTYLRHPGTYSVTVEINGCAASDSVEVKRNCFINIPNAFTPNGDGYNDYFLPRQLLSRNLSDFKMQIFNRWGEVVFETTSLNGRGWDGKVNDEFQPNGVYIYLIDVTFGNNTTERYQGNVTLLR